MSALNEVKDQMATVRSVGEFTNALQQIATMRMMHLRNQVIQSRPFVEEASKLLKELASLRNAMQTDDWEKLEEKYHAEHPVMDSNRFAVIVITSNQGLTGSYNPEIYTKVEHLLSENQTSDFYIIGKKGQEYFDTGHFKVRHFPYPLPDNFAMSDLIRLVNLFDYYAHITLVYSRFINTATRDVVAVSVVTPIPESLPDATKQPGKYIFEPDIYELIKGISRTLRSALFQQQIMDARLAQFSAQMVGMKAASDNADKLLADLRLEYNKQRRKMIDKKIGEVFAGSALWSS
jgi:F-type H+-transporting ATPase subunit gamma